VVRKFLLFIIPLVYLFIITGISDAATPCSEVFNNLNYEQRASDYLEGIPGSKPLFNEPVELQVILLRLMSRVTKDTNRLKGLIGKNFKELVKRKELKSNIVKRLKAHRLANPKSKYDNTLIYEQQEQEDVERLDWNIKELAYYASKINFNEWGAIILEFADGTYQSFFHTSRLPHQICLESIDPIIEQIPKKARSHDVISIIYVHIHPWRAFEPSKGDLDSTPEILSTLGDLFENDNIVYRSLILPLQDSRIDFLSESKMQKFRENYLNLKGARPLETLATDTPFIVEY
jgi:hypothetical protein